MLPSQRSATCAKGGVGASGERCPYRKHALWMPEEHQAWDVLMACLGQLRFGPWGHVLGIEMNAAMKVAEARDCDLGVISELLQAAEAGLVEAMN